MITYKGYEPYNSESSTFLRHDIGVSLSGSVRKYTKFTERKITQNCWNTFLFLRMVTELGHQIIEV